MHGGSRNINTAHTSLGGLQDVITIAAHTSGHPHCLSDMGINCDEVAPAFTESITVDSGIFAP